ALADAVAERGGEFRSGQPAVIADGDRTLLARGRFGADGLADQFDDFRGQGPADDAAYVVGLENFRRYFFHAGIHAWNVHPGIASIVMEKYSQNKFRSSCHGTRRTRYRFAARPDRKFSTRAGNQPESPGNDPPTNPTCPPCSGCSSVTAEETWSVRGRAATG